MESLVSFVGDGVAAGVGRMGVAAIPFFFFGWGAGATREPRLVGPFFLYGPRGPRGFLGAGLIGVEWFGLIVMPEGVSVGSWSEVLGD